MSAETKVIDSQLTTFENQPERTLFKRLLGVVGYGEAAGIAIAKERNVLFFSDDRKARRVAQDHGVEISGTLGLLKLAVEEGTLSVGEADEVLSQMIDGGYYSPIRSINELLGDGDSRTADHSHSESTRSRCSQRGGRRSANCID